MKEIYYIARFGYKKEGGYKGSIPSLPGCTIKGNSVEEIINNSKKATEDYLVNIIKKGLLIPKEKSRTKVFSIPIEVKLPSLT